MMSRPRITFLTLTFSDDSSIDLAATDIVVFVGPNNTGKSAALRDLHTHMGITRAGTVVSTATLQKTGTADAVRDYLAAYIVPSTGQQPPHYVTYDHALAGTEIVRLWNRAAIAGLAPFFCVLRKTETRITDSNPGRRRPTLKLLPHLASTFLTMGFNTQYSDYTARTTWRCC